MTADSDRPRLTWKDRLALLLAAAVFLAIVIAVGEQAMHSSSPPDSGSTPTEPVTP